VQVRVTLDRLRPMVSGAVTPSVRLARRLGLTPNGVSALAFALAVLGGVLFALAPRRGVAALYVGGSVCVALNGWLDVVDGELARALDGGSPAGDLLDHVLDRYADIVIVAGLAAGVERYALGFGAVTGVFMTSYLGTQAQAVGLDRVYGGLVGRADRLALVIAVGLAAAVVPGAVGPLTPVGWLLAFFAVVGHLTALQRFYYAYRAL
jgi:archaetidylinositol phosphate synthase